MTDSAAIDDVRRYYDSIASRYDEYAGYYERPFVGAGRRWVCEQTSGDVLEIGVGTGRNLPFYPPDIRLTGVDLTPAMLEIARQRAVVLGRDVDLRLGNAQALDLPDQAFDTVVATLVLSAVPDVGKTVAEAWRVLRPGGRFMLLDQARSPNPLVLAIQIILNPIFVRCHGDHLLREPRKHLTAAGFVIERLERSKGGFIERVVARKTAPANTER